MSQLMSSTQVISTRDLVKKRLAETKAKNAAPAGGAKQGVSRDHSSGTAMDRAKREKQNPTKLLRFSCESFDEPKFVTKRNTSQNRSQIFDSNR